jgi:hypothetical protein
VITKVYAVLKINSVPVPSQIVYVKHNVVVKSIVWILIKVVLVVYKLRILRKMVKLIYVRLINVSVWSTEESVIQIDA